MGLFKKKDEFEDFFNTADYCSIFVAEGLSDKYPEETIWLFNPILNISCFKLVPIIITFLAIRMAKTDQKSIERLPYKLRKKYDGIDMYLESYFEYIMEVEEKVKDYPPEEAMNGICVYSGYWLGSAIENEYKLDNQSYKFTDEFLIQVGNLIIDYAIEVCIPILEKK